MHDAAIRYLLAVVILLVLAAPARAGTRTLTHRSGPVGMGGYNVEFPQAAVRAPNVDGYLTHMTSGASRRC